MRLETAIGFTIRSVREDRMMFAKDVAARIPMSAGYLCEIERNEKLPSLLMLADIAEAMGLKLHELWFEIYKNIGSR